MRLRNWLFGLALGAAAFAQDVTQTSVPSVTAHGEAIVQAKPDRVEIQIGVVTQAQTAEAAGAQNSKQTSDVLAAIKKSLGTSAEVKTSSYSLQPQYNYRPNAKPTITGYQAMNTVEVTSADLTSTGKVIDAATGAGANNIQSVQFSVKDEGAARADALRLAAQKARASAEAMAAGLGMKLGRVLRISDSEPVRVFPAQRQVMMEAMQSKAAPDTPIEPGTVRIHAMVNITAELLR